METKELKIQIPEGYCIDESKSTFEKIVFKKIDTKPRSWEEYYKTYIVTGKEHFINYNCDIVEINHIAIGRHFSEHLSRCRNWIPSKELAEAFLSMMQLMSLRQVWIGDWNPDWSDEYLNKYCIIGKRHDFEVCIFNTCRHPLSFPTKEMAEDFMNTFKDLLNVAKPLI